ncbi:hypothetical protein NLJ89_g11815 [Agrocybe chaxingu]|uniref:Shelterin complex subunit TPP1/Est3 domain-containing protein n=1 Tax=Agrocybe chaxingu TaxID=84603 RepID=A0A9W8MQU3_9AGAR|nr:hypothetical protein NLJ89_g11815 [Agrocybe chaxingu]
MSDSLSPWLADYLIQSAEQHGANLSSIPLHSKKKKAQITEARALKVLTLVESLADRIMQFLSVGSENQDAFVWVRLSDKKYSIPARLWKETVAEYQRINGRITKDKGAILSIQNFKPMVMRIPMAGGSVTTNPSLALDCQTISLLGSAGEAVFGNPISITSIRELREWCEGLVQDGGAGNILKERKMQREGNAPGPSKLLPPMPTPPTPAPSLSRVQIGAPKVAQPPNRVKVTSIASYNARWQVVERNPALRAPPEEETPEKEDDNDVKEEPTGHPTPSSSRSSSPVTNWEHSPSIKDHESPTKAQPTSSDSIPAPTPAQRTRATVAIPETPEVTSSYLLGNETVEGEQSHVKFLALRLRRSV